MSDENLSPAHCADDFSYRMGDLIVTNRYLYVITGHRVRRVWPAAGLYYLRGERAWVNIDWMTYDLQYTDRRVIR